MPYGESAFAEAPFGAGPARKFHILVQWTQKVPRDWVETPSAVWSSLPDLGVPLPGQIGGGTDALGWVHRLNVQGVQFVGDHYAVEDLPPDGCRVTAWWDDPDSYPDGQWFASQWTFLKPAPDPRIDGGMNTRQSKIVYAQPERLALFATHFGVSVAELDTVIEDTIFKPWSEFVPPPASATRHGVWVSDELNLAHEALQSSRGWREWIVGG